MKTVIPEWLADHVVGTATFEFEGVTYEYAIVRSSFGTERDAPSVFTIASNGVLAVSDAYPEAWRELGLIHEVQDYYRQPKMSCEQSLAAELHLANARGMDSKEYRKFRLHFFLDLVAFYQRHPQQAVPGLLEGLQGSLAYLHHLVVGF